MLKIRRNKGVTTKACQGICMKTIEKVSIAVAERYTTGRNATPEWRFHRHSNLVSSSVELLPFFPPFRIIAFLSLLMDATR